MTNLEYLDFLKKIRDKGIKIIPSITNIKVFDTIMPLQVLTNDILIEDEINYTESLINKELRRIQHNINKKEITKLVFTEDEEVLGDIKILNS